MVLPTTKISLAFVTLPFQVNAKYLRWNFKGNVRTWLKKNYQSDEIIKFFWIPFVESTLNTSWNEASFS